MLCASFIFRSNSTMEEIMSEHPGRPNHVVPSRTFVPFVVVVLFLLGCAGAPKHPTWKNATGAEQHERLMWQAIRDKDWNDVEYHLAPTFVGVNASGQALDRAAWVSYWKSMQIKEFSIAEIAVQPAGTHMVVTYVFHAGANQGAATALGAGLRVVSVWQQVKHGWILTTTAMTPIAPVQNISRPTGILELDLRHLSTRPPEPLQSRALKSQVPGVGALLPLRGCLGLRKPGSSHGAPQVV